MACEYCNIKITGMRVICSGCHKHYHLRCTTLKNPNENSTTENWFCTAECSAHGSPDPEGEDNPFEFTCADPENPSNKEILAGLMQSPSIVSKNGTTNT
jgi:hypothetical protein